MRNSALVLVAGVLMAGCSGSSSSSGGPNPNGGTAIVSCDWGGGTCDQYSGTIDPTFATNLQTTCGMHGVAFASGPCPSAGQVAGHCDLGTSGGMSDAYYYYSPTYDATSAKADCLSAVVGVAWVP